MKDIASLDPFLEARLIKAQEKVASRVVLEDRFSEESIAGVDQAFFQDTVISASVILNNSLRLSGNAFSTRKENFPYIPGFLSFREGASAVEAVRRLKPMPTLLFVDGCGIDHPRSAGLASFVGTVLDMPTIGISKNALCGCFDRPEAAGEAKLLKYDGKDVDFVLKSKEDCRPIFVAPGHRIALESALKVTRRCLKGHKLPEPLRLAHEQARLFKKDLSLGREAFL